MARPSPATCPRQALQERRRTWGDARGVAAATTGLALFARASQAAGEAVPAAPAVPAAAPAPASPFAAYVEIREDGTVRITCPQAEIGQGVHDALPRILADEMDADWPAVVVVQPHGDAAFVSPINKRQRIGGSNSIMAYRDPPRVRCHRPRR